MDEDIEEEERIAGLPPAELARSYFAFLTRAVRARRLLAALVFVVVSGLTIGLTAVWPRTYHCESRLSTQGTGLLEERRDDVGRLDGAFNVIVRRENLEQIAKQADLVRDWDLRRPPLLRLKDRIMSALRGPPSEASKMSGLMDLLGSRISANVTEGALAIGVDWPDGPSAARIVETAQQIFIESRHSAEVATVHEKIAILDDHANKLRLEIGRLAEQVQKVREDKLSDLGKDAKDLDPAPSAVAQSSAQPRRIARAAEPDEELPGFKEELEAKKKELGELEADRRRRLAEGTAKLDDLKLHLTPAHPMVVAQEQTVERLTHESERVTTLKADILVLEATITQRITAARGATTPVGGTGQGVVPGATGSRSAPDVLPPNVIRLLENGSAVDPAVSAQLSAAVVKYGALREAVRSALIDLDTAQAAFNHRYKIIAPPEVPTSPSKPKIPVMIGAGLFLALLLALLVPTLLELRTGIIVEQWQVQQLQLPILAKLILPPGSRD